MGILKFFGNLLGRREHFGKKHLELDKITMVMIPRILDDDPKMFLDEHLFLEYSTNQADTFMKSLPPEAQGKMSVDQASLDNFRKQGSLDRKVGFYQVDSPYQVGLGFLPDYFVIYESLDIHAPRFFLRFFPIKKEPSKRIIELALNQFYIQEKDTGNSELLVMGSKDEEIVLIGLDCLRNYLPKGTKIEGRCNEMLANLPTKYKL